MSNETTMNYAQVSQAVSIAAWKAAGINTLTKENTEEVALNNWLDVAIQDWKKDTRKLWMGGTPTTVAPTTVAPTTS